MVRNLPGGAPGCIRWENAYHLLAIPPDKVPRLTIYNYNIYNIFLVLSRRFGKSGEIRFREWANIVQPIR